MSYLSFPLVIAYVMIAICTSSAAAAGQWSGQVGLTVSRHSSSCESYCPGKPSLVSLSPLPLYGMRLSGLCTKNFWLEEVNGRSSCGDRSFFGRRTLRIVPLMCQWTLGRPIVDDWGERASGCGRAGRRGVTTTSTPSRVL